MFSISSALKVGTLALATLLCFPGLAAARGVSPYLPLHMSPEIERQIEQVMLFAGQPIVRRPIPAATVLDALPVACEVDEALCRRVRKYLSAYMGRYAVTHASIEVAATEDSGRTLPNSRGMSTQDAWTASIVAHFQASDYVLLQLGGVAYPDETMASGSVLSLGQRIRADRLGFRDHWWSPMTDSSMLIGTQAPNHAWRHAVELHADLEARLPLRSVHGAHEPSRRHCFRGRHDQRLSATCSVCRSRSTRCAAGR